jgi:hypothetical protein
MVSENGRYRGLLMDWGGVLTSDLFASFSAFCELEGLEPDAVAGRMEISTYGGKTDYGKRDLYASESILEAARDAYDRLGGPNPHRLTAPDADGCAVPGEELATDRVEAGTASGGAGGHRSDSARPTPFEAVVNGEVRQGHARRSPAVRGHHDVAFTLARYGDHFSSSAIRPEIYLAG